MKHITILLCVILGLSVGTVRCRPHKYHRKHSHHQSMVGSKKAKLYEKPDEEMKLEPQLTAGEDDKESQSHQRALLSCTDAACMEEKGSQLEEYVLSKMKSNIAQHSIDEDRAQTPPLTSKEQEEIKHAPQITSSAAENEIQNNTKSTKEMVERKPDSNPSDNNNNTTSDSNDPPAQEKRKKEKEEDANNLEDSQQNKEDSDKEEKENSRYKELVAEVSQQEDNMDENPVENDSKNAGNNNNQNQNNDVDQAAAQATLQGSNNKKLIDKLLANERRKEMQEKESRKNDNQEMKSKQQDNDKSKQQREDVSEKSSSDDVKSFTHMNDVVQHARHSVAQTKSTCTNSSCKLEAPDEKPTHSEKENKAAEEEEKKNDEDEKDHASVDKENKTENEEKDDKPADDADERTYNEEDENKKNSKDELHSSCTDNECGLKESEKDGAHSNHSSDASESSLKSNSKESEDEKMEDHKKEDESRKIDDNESEQDQEVQLEESVASNIAGKSKAKEAAAEEERKEIDQHNAQIKSECTDEACSAGLELKENNKEKEENSSKDSDDDKLDSDNEEAKISSTHEREEEIQNKTNGEDSNQHHPEPVKDDEANVKSKCTASFCSLKPPSEAARIHFKNSAEMKGEKSKNETTKTNTDSDQAKIKADKGDIDSQCTDSACSLEAPGPDKDNDISDKENEGFKVITGKKPADSMKTLTTNPKENEETEKEDPHTKSECVDLQCEGDSVDPNDVETEEEIIKDKQFAESIQGKIAQYNRTEQQNQLKEKGQNSQITADGVATTSADTPGTPMGSESTVNIKEQDDRLFTVHDDRERGSLLESSSRNQDKEHFVDPKTSEYPIQESENNMKYDYDFSSNYIL